MTLKHLQIKLNQIDLMERIKNENIDTLLTLKQHRPPPPPPSIVTLDT